MCDALNRMPRNMFGATCWRCQSPLHGALHNTADELLARLSSVAALLCATWVCIFTAHALPMVSLALGASHSSVTLFGASHALWLQDREALSAALFVTTVMAPALEMAAMLLVVLTLALRVRQLQRGEALPPAPRWLVATLHLWQGMREWNMTEVLVLGTAVALVKLGQLATLIVGPGLIALMAFMALRLAALRLLSPVDAWSLLEPAPRRGSSAPLAIGESA
jgi:paraquat-inducible protein A